METPRNVLETPRPGAMTALANRLNSIQLQLSPNDALKPSHLTFDDEVDDKENRGDDQLKGAAVWGIVPDFKEKLGDIQLKNPILPVPSSNIPNATLNESLNHSGKEALSSSAPGSDPKASPSGNVANLDVFKANLEKVIQGKQTWPWIERCEAMSSLTTVLQNEPPSPILEHLSSSLVTLSSKINDHLDELRPTVISSAISLVNAVLSTNVAYMDTFSSDVFPSIMDLACGRSLSAEDAAKSLCYALRQRPELKRHLNDCDNPERLIQVIEQLKTNPAYPRNVRENAAQASLIARQVLKVTTDIPSRPQSARNTEDNRPSPNATRPAEVKSNPQDFQTPQPKSTLPSNTSSHARSMRHSYRHSMRSPAFADRLREITLTSNLKSPGQAEARHGIPLVRNKKLDDSTRKHSPGSGKKRRMYTEEDLEQARRLASKTNVEQMKKEYEREIESLRSSKDSIEKLLRKEKHEVTELKSVLEEYELTMQKMVSHGNSQISSQLQSLQQDKNHLKAELLDVSESFEALKQRYESAKETVAVFETKENRFVEQIKELKKNMVELQKWSNDLKANSEKKLSKAFESVTTYRASYIDMEAHAKKAMSDLERTKNDLKREQESHAETAARLAGTESELHSEQDARSSAEASLSTAKTTLRRLTEQKDRMGSELHKTKDDFSTMKQRLAELEEKEARFEATQKRMDQLTKENQNLKARAYDDMSKISNLEAEVQAREADVEELSAICDEAMTKLEEAGLAK